MQGSGNGFSVDVRQTYVDGVLRLAHPLVPEKVRLGRKWRVLRHGDVLYEYEVTSREVVATPHGVRPVWTIEQRNRGNGIVTVRRYVEGRGQLELNDTSAVVLDDGALPTEPALEPSPLTEIPAGEELRGVVVSTATFVRDAGETSGLLILRAGRYPFLRGRDLAASFAPSTVHEELLKRLAFDVVGPVPGVGRMALGLVQERSAASFTNPMTTVPFAPLRGGGYVTATRLWARRVDRTGDHSVQGPAGT